MLRFTLKDEQENSKQEGKKKNVLIQRRSYETLLGFLGPNLAHEPDVWFKFGEREHAVCILPTLRLVISGFPVTWLLIFVLPQAC